MNIKELLKNLIKEEMENRIQEQPENDQQKEMFRQNAAKQVKLLRFMRETLKSGDMQQIRNMSQQLNKANTADFVEQVLNVNKSIPINIKAALLDPLGLLQSLIDEIIKLSINSAKQKLSETDLPFLTRDLARIDKRNKKLNKKQKKEYPEPKLNNDK